MLILIAERQVQIVVRRLLRFLNESVQQDHSALFVDVKKDPRDSVLSQVRPHFIDTVSQWLANGHPNGPAEFHRFDVLPDAFPIFRGKPL
jgi:hypothetical protein